jgi:thiol-disulfide isomerase/thioredoxin
LKLDEASEKGDTTKARIFYNRLMSEFGDIPEAVSSRKTLYDPNRAIMKGKIVPAFSVASLSQPGVIYTNESMKGKIYLMDFWGVWCGPCIKEMPYLHRAHGKF